MRKNFIRMNNNDIQAQLSEKLPAFQNSDLVNFIQKEGEIIFLKKNETLVGYQQQDKKLYILLHGSILHNLITSRGEEKTIMFHTESFVSFFKSYDAIFQHKKTDYTLKANENSVVIALPFDTLEKLIFSDLEYLHFYTRETENLLATIQHFNNFRLALTSEEYLHWLYTEYGFLFKRFSAQNIANFIGITPIWLSKLKRKFLEQQKSNS